MREPGSRRRRRPVGFYRCIAPEREGRTPLAFIAFERTDLLPAMRARHDASAQSKRITRGLIVRREVMFHTLGDQLHIHHRPTLWEHPGRDLVNQSQVLELGERVPAGR